MEERLLVFVSSSINELSQERATVKKAIEAIPLTRAWLFELSPASVDPVEETYLRKVRACDLFILVLGEQLPVPVYKEWRTAVAASKPRLVFLKQGARSLEVQTFIKNVLDVKWGEFANLNNLERLVQESVVDELIKVYRFNHQDTDRLHDFLKRLRQDASEIGKRYAIHETHFHGSVTGPVHVGLGNININSIQNQEVQKEWEQTQKLKAEEAAIKIKQTQMKFYGPLIEQGQWQLLALQLSNNPEDVQGVLQMIEQKRQMELGFAQKTLEAILAKGSPQGWEMHEQGMEILNHIVGVLKSEFSKPALAEGKKPAALEPTKASEGKAEKVTRIVRVSG